MASPVAIGCAGWDIPKEFADRFPEAGTHLERYSQSLPAVEINSSFYRPHRPQTYARWAASVPAHFLFAVKVPRTITHEKGLVDSQALLTRFLGEVSALGDKLGPLLVQLPPRLAFASEHAPAFFAALRDHFDGDVVCEPRHPSWFAADAEDVLRENRVARVAADPPPVPQAAQPGGWPGLVYFRLHGSPRIYYSAYSDAYLETLAQALTVVSASAPTWCIFDNTALGAATANALGTLKLTALREEAVFAQRRRHLAGLDTTNS